MDEATFRQALKEAGKQPHVIEELVRQAHAFEAYLSQQGRALDATSAQDIHDYVGTLSEREAKARLRGVAL